MRKVDEAEPPILGSGGDAVPVIDNPDVLTIYTDDVLDIEIHDNNARITYFEYRGHGADRVRVPVLIRVCPVASCRRGVALFFQRDAEVRGRHH